MEDRLALLEQKIKALEDWIIDSKPIDPKKYKKIKPKKKSKKAEIAELKKRLYKL